MARFKYTARSKTGEKLSGTVAASSKAAAVKEVERKGLFPISIDPDHASTGENTATTTTTRRLFPERIERLDYFLRWLLFFILVPVVAAFLLPLPKYIGIPEWLPFVVVILLFLLRFPCAGFRSIGWSPWLALLFIVPIVNFVIQLILFFLPAKEVDA